MNFNRITFHLSYLMSSSMLLASNPANTESLLTLYENDCVRLEVAERPLAKNAVDITLKQPVPIGQIEEQCFGDIWDTRYIAEKHLANAGYENRLCYSKIKGDRPASWQVVSYSSLPWYLDNVVFRKIYSIWKQATVLYRTAFSASPLSEKEAGKVRSFWSIHGMQAGERGSRKTGTGALTKSDVIQKQLVHPLNPSSEDNDILLLYNYAPLRTGGEQMHFLLVPNPSKPAKNFLELDREQYVKVQNLTKKVSLWAEREFKGRATIHFFDKTGEIAGQTQPLYHAHLIIVTEEKEEIWGKLSMFLRMLIPSSPLPGNELKRRVTHYRKSLGNFIAHQD